MGDKSSIIDRLPAAGIITVVAEKLAEKAGVRQ